MSAVRRTFNTINDPTGVGIRVPEMTKLQNNMPDQFGIAFVLDSDLRGDGNLGRENIPLSRNGVVKYQITSGVNRYLKKVLWTGETNQPCIKKYGKCSVIFGVKKVIPCAMTVATRNGNILQMVRNGLGSYYI